jgi:glycine/D-amino acid oxidase-like deaminating enzyme
VTWDVVVVGLGVIGSAIARELAGRGKRVLGVDRHAASSELGSSGGESRMFRRVYPEGDAFVPLVTRSMEAWRALERDHEARLVWPSGGVVVGAPGRPLFDTVVTTAERQGIPYEVLEPSVLAMRLPMLALEAGEVGFVERDAGVLAADACVAALRASAVARGAELRFETPVSLDRARARDGELEVAGKRVGFGTLVLAVGSWAVQVKHPAMPAVTAERVVTGWFGPGGPEYHASRLPFIVLDRGERPISLVPDLGRGVKVGLQRSGVLVDPDAMDRSATASEIEEISARARAASPRLAEPRGWHASTYTDAPGGGFAIRRLDGRTVLACACAGHAFKLAPSIAETACEVVG